MCPPVIGLIRALTDMQSRLSLLQHGLLTRARRLQALVLLVRIRQSILHQALASRHTLRCTTGGRSLCRLPRPALMPWHSVTS